MLQPQHKTRHNYHKHDVLSALTVSLLRQQQQDALFWAFELLCSENQNQKNYKKRTVNHLLGCFYYFYFTQSQHMESKVLTLLKPKDEKAPVEQTVAQVIKLFVKLPFNLDVYLLQSWWWISATTDDDDDAKYKKETKRWFENHTAKESRIALARYIVQEQEKKEENKKIKKIYVTQVPEEQWLPLTQLQPCKDDDGNLILPKPMIACDCWTQMKDESKENQKKKQEKEPLKIKDLLTELTNANKITNSVLIGKHAISEDELHDMQFLTQETVANYWTNETENKEAMQAEMMACFPAYNQSKIK
jgi:hypothetical protein